MSVFDGTHVVAVNANGEKQTIPAHWLDHPVLSRGFRKPPSEQAAGKSRGAKKESPSDGETVKGAENA